MIPEPNLIELRAAGENFSADILCDAVATDGFFVMLLSTAGPQMTINAIAAGLRNPGSMQFKPHRMERLLETYNYDRSLKVREVGYEMSKTPIGYDLWHLVAVARSSTLLIRDTPDALWSLLSGPPFTTPMLRSWLPHIEPKLRVDERHLRKLRSFGCDAAQLHITNEQLDEIVSDGVKSGRMKIA